MHVHRCSTCVCVYSMPHDICSFLPMEHALHDNRLIDKWQEKEHIQDMTGRG